MSRAVRGSSALAETLRSMLRTALILDGAWAAAGWVFVRSPSWTTEIGPVVFMALGVVLALTRTSLWRRREHAWTKGGRR